MRSIYRSRRVHIQHYIYIVLFIAALLMSIIFVSSRTFADSTNNSTKMYKSIIVYAGDSLESIAKSYYSNECGSIGRYVSEIASINNITPDSRLIPGNHIIIPYYEIDNSYHFIVSTQ